MTNLLLAHVNMPFESRSPRPLQLQRLSLLQVLKLGVSKRIASRLAKWKWLNYSEAHDETELGFLNLSLVAAGYLSRDSVDEALLLFAESAMGPLCTRDDMQDLDDGEERRLLSPRVNYSFVIPPVLVPAAAPPAPASDVVSLVSAVVEALDIPNIVKKCTKRSRDSDPDSKGEEVDRFARLTSFGSQEL